MSSNVRCDAPKPENGNVEMRASSTSPGARLPDLWCGIGRRPGWDLNPRGPKDQQLTWSNFLRSRGSTPSAPKRTGSVAVPGSATRAGCPECLPRINVVLWKHPSTPLTQDEVQILQQSCLLSIEPSRKHVSVHVRFLDPKVETAEDVASPQRSGNAESTSLVKVSICLSLASA